MSAEDEVNAKEAFKKISRVTLFAYFWLIGTLSIGLILFALSRDLYSDRIILASGSVLTFVALFYSLLISREGKNVAETITQIINSIEEQLKKTVKEEIGKSSNLKKTLNKFKSTNEYIIFAKRFTNLESFLFFAVMSFFVSIIISLVGFPLSDFFSYFGFVVGLSFSNALVYEWSSISRIAKSYESKKNKTVVIVSGGTNEVPPITIPVNKL